MRLTSPSFDPDGEIPRRFTCQGEDVSPALGFADVPEGTKRLVLIVDDPDAPDPAAPKRTWVHWVLYDLPPGLAGLAEGASARAAGGRAGENDWGRPTWGGPCPPIGRHRYFFKLYALDATLGDLHTPTKGQVLTGMTGHVLAEATRIGTYQKR